MNCRRRRRRTCPLVSRIRGSLLALTTAAQHRFAADGLRPQLKPIRSAAGGRGTQEAHHRLPERPPSPSPGRPSLRAARSRAQHLSPLAAGERSDLPASPPIAEHAKQKKNDQDNDDEGRCCHFVSSFGHSRTGPERRAAQLVGFRSRRPRIVSPMKPIRPEVAGELIGDCFARRPLNTPLGCTTPD